METKLTLTLRAALRECVEWNRHQSYIWKPKSMQKLEAMGLVEKEQLMYAGKVAYVPTEAGRRAVSANCSGEQK